MTSSASEPRAVACAALSFLLTLGALAAHAQAPAEDANRAAARRLANEGFAALDRHQPAEADAHFSRAIALYSAPTLHLARGRARVQLNWLVAAGEDFRAAARIPVEPKEPAAFAGARADAAKELAALEPRIPTLTVLLTGAAPRDLRVNGTPWPLASVGVARPLDPGRYVVEAIDTAGRTHEAEVVLEERRPSSVTIDVPAAAATTPAGAAAAPDGSAATGTAAPAQASAPTPAPAAATTDDSSSSTAVWVSAGATLAFVVGAVITGVLALDRRADYDKYNDPDYRPAVTPDKKRELRDSANAMAWVNTALVGAALAGGGLTAYLWISEPDSEESAQRATPRGRAAGATVRVAF